MLQPYKLVKILTSKVTSWTLQGHPRCQLGRDLGRYRGTHRREASAAGECSAPAADAGLLPRHPPSCQGRALDACLCLNFACQISLRAPLAMLGFGFGVCSEGDGL